MVVESIAVLSIGCVWYIYLYLKKRKLEQFTIYLKQQYLALGELKATGWLVSGVDIPKQIDYTATWNKFDKSMIWDYDFASMIVLEKKK